MPITVHRSKVDSWLLIVLVGAAAIMVVSVISVAVTESLSSALLMSPVLLITAGLPLWLLRSTYYVLDETELKIHSGPFRWRVRLGDIRNVAPTRNPLSSPALSLDRLRIDYGKRKSIMISPEDREAFLADLERRRAPV
jgi:hypothetical protein